MSVLILFTGHDLHSFFSYTRATCLMFFSIDRHTAFEANAHTAKRATRFAGDRRSEIIDARRQDRDGDGSSVGDFYLVSI